MNMAAKYTDENADVSNFSDVTIELQRILHLIGDNENTPLVSLEEAINPLISLVPDLEKMIATVKKNRSITNDESMSIALYSIEWKPRDKSFHVILNTTLQTADRTLLKPWFCYLKLIMTALAKLPSHPTRLTIYHAIKLNLIAQYPLGRTFVWWGFTLCTKSLDFFNNEYVLGQNGARTLFIIDSQSGKSIREHSFYTTEEDILLPPACQFQTTGSFDAGNGLYIIHLKEISPKYQLRNSVLLPPITSPNRKVTTSSSEKSKSDMPGPPHSSPVPSQLKVNLPKYLPKIQTTRKPIKNTSNTPIVPKQRNISVKRIDTKVQKCIEALNSDPVIIYIHFCH
jgi:hypothetical protein